MQAPPVLVAQARTAGAAHSAAQPLIDLSQAAPVGAPPPELRDHLVELLASDANIHRYGPILGDDELRQEIATQWSQTYRAHIRPAEVGVTAGCNQAFCAAIASVANVGDEVIVPTPWYFNHKMWLDMAGIRAIPLLTRVDNQFIPDPQAAHELVTPATRAIVLVSPNNPTGIAYPAEVIQQFYAVARTANIVLIVDETYREFRITDAPPHHLFTATDWANHFCHLYSFSKVYRIPGHRVGAVVTGEHRLVQIQKFLDTVTICPPRLGQAAALYGLRHLGDWVAAERAEILRRGKHLRELLQPRPGGFELATLGAYFAYVKHPFAQSGQAVAEQLIEQSGIIALEDSLFQPTMEPHPQSLHLRLAFANVSCEELTHVADRLAQLRT